MGRQRLPARVERNAIPLAARIFAVVDVWDALTSDRPYRKAMTYDEAMDCIIQNTGSHFDPKVVELFLKYQDQAKI